MISDEKGYIQFQCLWDKAPSIEYDRLSELIHWRVRLFDERLVGVDANGLGYGNVSERVGSGDTFVITAVQTGRLRTLDASHFALVSDFDVHGNRIRCSGAMRASSESLSHAILYEADSEIGAVVHAHDAESWDRLRDRVPTTGPHAGPGTVAMADEIDRLMRASNLAREKVLVMGGHKDGLISFGRNIGEACTIMLKACGRDVPSERVSGPTIDQF